MVTPGDAGRLGAAAPLRSFSSRGEYVYAALRDAIHQGRFGPGARVVEVEIARELGVSRTPVRDALRRLESDGLLIVAPRRGLSVATLDQQQVLELYALREVLEGTAARLAAQHAGEGEIGALHDLVGRHRARLHDGPTALMSLNREFHQVIYQAARNRYVLQSLHSLRDSLALLPGTTYAAPGRPVAALAEHDRIVQAIARRDPAAAEEAARAHIRTAERVRRTLMAADGYRSDD